MIVITIFAGSYLLHFHPFDEPLINRLEAMNEFFMLLLIRIIFCFTKIIDNPS